MSMLENEIAYRIKVKKGALETLRQLQIRTYPTSEERTRINEQIALLHQEIGGLERYNKDLLIKQIAKAFDVPVSVLLGDETKDDTTQKPKKKRTIQILKEVKQEPEIAEPDLVITLGELVDSSVVDSESPFRKIIEEDSKTFEVKDSQKQSVPNLNINQQLLDDGAISMQELDRAISSQLQKDQDNKIMDEWLKGSSHNVVLMPDGTIEAVDQFNTDEIIKHIEETRTDDL